MGCERAPSIEYRGAFTCEIREVVVADIGGMVCGSFFDADDVPSARFQFGGNHRSRRAFPAIWQPFDDDQTGSHLICAHDVMVRRRICGMCRCPCI